MTFVLIMSKNSASGGFWSPKVGEVPTVRFSDIAIDPPTFHKL
jgi:hypothetical protein